MTTLQNTTDVKDKDSVNVEKNDDNLATSEKENLTNGFDKIHKKKKEKNVDIADNAYHRIARKAGALLISNGVYYAYNIFVDRLLENILRKAIALSADSGNKIIKREVFATAVFLETGKYPIATIQSGKKAQLPNFKPKHSGVTPPIDDNASVSSTNTNRNRLNPGRIAEKEIQEFQRQYDSLYMAKTPFGNKVKMIADQVSRDINVLYNTGKSNKQNNGQYMFQHGVYLMAQSFIEQYILDLTQISLKLTKHAKRGTLYYEDIILALEISSQMGNGFTFSIDDIKTHVEISIANAKKKLL